MVLRKDVSWVETDYGAALLDERSGRYWTLNPTGSIALRVLLRGGDTRAAAQEIAASYAVDTETAGRDIETLLSQLENAGLTATSWRTL